MALTFSDSYQVEGLPQNSSISSGKAPYFSQGKSETKTANSQTEKLLPEGLIQDMQKYSFFNYWLNGSLPLWTQTDLREIVALFQYLPVVCHRLVPFLLSVGIHDSSFIQEDMGCFIVQNIWSEFS